MKKPKKKPNLVICDHANKNDCDNGHGCDHNIPHVPFIEDGESEKCNIETGCCGQTAKDLAVCCIPVKKKRKKS